MERPAADRHTAPTRQHTQPIPGNAVPFGTNQSHNRNPGLPLPPHPGFPLGSTHPSSLPARSLCEKKVKEVHETILSGLTKVRLCWMRQTRLNSNQHGFSANESGVYNK
jgi:hypothetical protein